MIGATLNCTIGGVGIPLAEAIHRHGRRLQANLEISSRFALIFDDMPKTRKRPRGSKVARRVRLRDGVDSRRWRCQLMQPRNRSQYCSSRSSTSSGRLRTIRARLLQLRSRKPFVV
jgi:hypothetical protein